MDLIERLRARANEERAVPDMGHNAAERERSRLIRLLTEAADALEAAQQQGQAMACVACEHKPAPGNSPCGWCGRTAPPSVPVGVGRLVSQWRSGCISAQEAMISISQQPLSASVEVVKERTMASYKKRTDEMYLVYKDEENNRHYQHWADLQESGTLIDPETGDDLELVGWATPG